MVKLIASPEALLVSKSSSITLGTNPLFCSSQIAMPGPCTYAEFSIYRYNNFYMGLSAFADTETLPPCYMSSLLLSITGTGRCQINILKLHANKLSSNMCSLHRHLVDNSTN